MSQLFDTSPTEDQVRKKASRPRRVAVVEEERPAVADIAAPPRRPPVLIGTIDHTYACGGAGCGAECHDIIAEGGGEWLIQCCFCGLMERVRAIPGHLKPKGKEFRFHDGRFEGLTLDEAAALPRGLDYIEESAKDHPRDAVRTACKTWLDARRVAS